MAKKRVNVYELKDLRNPILRKKAEKKFKKMKNPKDYDNPDYYERKSGGKVYKVDNSGQNLVQKMYGGKIK